MEWVELSRYAGVIFDWDGTLVDSQPLNYASLAAALAPYHVTLERDWYWQRLGTSAGDLLSELGVTVPVSDVVADCKRRIIAGAAGLVVRTPVVELARRAKEAGVALAIASGGAREVVRAGLVATGLDELFSVVVAYEDAERGKPAPDVFLRAASRIGAEAGRCLAVEDADEGVVAARAAGMTVLDVRDGMLDAR
ncbi:HAD family hydrolase [Streptomyces boninensis]|uniref:HAD family hydrolase n=1 Tax=Streptomyces boninensis TaxID=2039455 RepID=UPI003B221D1C